MHSVESCLRQAPLCQVWLCGDFEAGIRAGGQATRRRHTPSQTESTHTVSVLLIFSVTKDFNWKQKVSTANAGSRENGVTSSLPVWPCVRPSPVPLESVSYWMMMISLVSRPIAVVVNGATGWVSVFTDWPPGFSRRSAETVHQSTDIRVSAKTWLTQSVWPSWHVRVTSINQSDYQYKRDSIELKPTN